MRKRYCPKCGSEELGYQQIKEKYQSSSISIRIAKGVNLRKNVGSPSYRNYAKCLDCGHEWEINKKISLTKLVLVIIFLPFAIGIWFYRTDRIKLKRLYRIIVILVCTALLILFSYAGNNDEVDTTKKPVNDVQLGEIKTTVPKLVDDDLINKFLDDFDLKNKYPITIQKSSRKYVGCGWFGTHYFEVENLSSSSTFRVQINGATSIENRTKEDDMEVLEIATHIMKMLSPTLSEEKLEDFETDFKKEKSMWEYDFYDNLTIDCMYSSEKNSSYIRITATNYK